MFLRSRYYPVDLDRRIIYDDPKQTARAVYTSPVYRASTQREDGTLRHWGVTEIKGSRLNAHAVWQAYEVRPALALEDLA